MIGTVELGSIATCEAVAIAPPIRYSSRKRHRPLRSSMLLPKTHRNSMLPKRCGMLSCRNMVRNAAR